MAYGPITESSGIVTLVPTGIGYGAKGMSEMPYEVVPANALTLDERSIVLPAQTDVVPDGLIVKEGFCPNNGDREAIQKRKIR